ncbi:GntR family transcriptional regulator [Roseomonas elaeocarpi]|uniref:GntR family transcriptional regulator n=1 Tax=Roseomonas elaeocarpi TaxID=907779 RepID=A0ABV6JYX8_9PROT
MTEDGGALPLTLQALHQLRQEILSCDLLPGATLSETAASQRLGLGKAPIRAALARLAEEGLVGSVARRGWVVSLITIRDIHEVFDLRLLLEPEGARRAAARTDPSARRQLEALLSAEAPPDSRALHQAIAVLSGNTRLAQGVSRLLDESSRMLAFAARHGTDLPEEPADRAALLQAVAEGRGVEAARLIYDRVWSLRSAVLAALTAPEAATPV